MPLILDGTNGVNASTGSLNLQTGGTSGITLSSAQVATFANPSSGAVKKTTRQIFTSGSSATYTTPSGCTQLRVLIVGGGGGGAGGGNYGGTGATGGGTGGTTTFNSVTAIGGSGGGAGLAGPQGGGTGGSNGTATNPVRTKGASGGVQTSAVINYVSDVYVQSKGGAGACGYGGGYGGGGTGGSASDTGTGSTGGSLGGGGGGAGEMVDFYINSPAASYTYTVGSGGSQGSGGSYNPGAGGAGSGGLIIVDEYYY